MTDIQHYSLPTSPPYTPTAIANSFIDRFGGKESYGTKDGIDHLKLQKLVYCAYGWWLVTRNGQRLTTEGPEIWRHGPVFGSMYKVFKIFGNRPIKDMQSANPDFDPVTVNSQDQKTLHFLDWIWNRYGHLSALSLSALTHQEGSPWHKTAVDHDFTVKKVRKYQINIFSKNLKHC